MISRQKEVCTPFAPIYRIVPSALSVASSQVKILTPFLLPAIQLITVWENYQQMLLKRVGGAGGGGAVPAAQDVMS